MMSWCIQFNAYFAKILNNRWWILVFCWFLNSFPIWMWESINWNFFVLIHLLEAQEKISHGFWNCIGASICKYSYPCAINNHWNKTEINENLAQEIRGIQTIKLMRKKSVLMVYDAVIDQRSQLKHWNQCNLHRIKKKQISIVWCNVKKSLLN